ncbi:hypothetical protein D3C85_823670 [compost metagenome]
MQLVHLRQITDVESGARNDPGFWPAGHHLGNDAEGIVPQVQEKPPWSGFGQGAGGPGGQAGFFQGHKFEPGHATNVRHSPQGVAVELEYFQVGQLLEP